MTRILSAVASTDLTFKIALCLASAPDVRAVGCVTNATAMPDSIRSGRPNLLILNDRLFLAMLPDSQIGSFQKMKILNKLSVQNKKIELIRILLICLPSMVIVGCAFASPFQSSRTVSMGAIVASPTLGVVVDEKLMIVDLTSERIGEQMGLQKGDILISLNGALFDVKNQSEQGSRPMTTIRTYRLISK